MTRHERWWWRVWYVFFASVLLWLGLCGWLARPIEPWATGWLAWWTGDRSDSQPLVQMATKIGQGVRVVPINGDAAYYTSAGSSTGLGHWGPSDDHWTWAGWVRVQSNSGVWPTNFVVVRTATSAVFELRAGFQGGRPYALFATRDSPQRINPWNSAQMSGSNAMVLGEWMHLACGADLGMQHLWVNGIEVSRQRWDPKYQIALAALSLRSELYEPSVVKTVEAQCTVEHDDVVAFDRLLSNEEMAGLVARGRGGWAAEVERPAKAGRVWSMGWRIALALLVGLLAAKLLPSYREHLVPWVKQGLQPGYQTVRWTLATGLLISIIGTGGIAMTARRSDAARFDEALQRFKQNTDSEWERIAALCVRTKDWISIQPQVNHEDWKSWLHGNRFPYAYPGVIGIGYAEQVLPANVATHEAQWSARHGFAYRIHPPVTEPRHEVIELEGDPHLPVVLYEAANLNRQAWFTNHLFLGKNLLYQSPKDQRPWAEARRVEEVAARNEIQTSSLEEIGPASLHGKSLRGLRLYAPSTLRTKQDHSWVVLESAAWRGVAFASVDMERLLLERFGTNASPLGFKVFTARSTGERLDLVADSRNFLPGTVEPANPVFKRTMEMRFYYRRLFVEAWSTEAFEAQSMQPWAWLTGAGGAGLTLLASGLLFVQIRAREAQAGVMEALHAANSKLLLAYRERESLSRDLHDGSIQNFYALGLHLHRVQALFDGHPKQAQSELKESVAMLDYSIEALRQFILTSGIDNLKEHTLTLAIEALVMRLRRTTETKFDLRLDAAIGTLSPQAGVQLINIVREGISNALRHAKAKRITISLERIPQSEGEPGRWNLQIADDGGGFDVKRVNGHGSGLRNMASRATELGGKCDIQSTPGAGARVTVEFSEQST